MHADWATLENVNDLNTKNYRGEKGEKSTREKFNISSRWENE